MKVLRTQIVVSLTDEEQHDKHQEVLDQTGFWGSQGAGCLFLAADTKRLLFAHRSDEVLEPGTYGTWGGAIDDGEDILQAVIREVKEESGFTGSIKLIKLAVFTSKPSGFKYHNFLAIVPKQFKPKLDWETQGYLWTDFNSWPKPLHPGCKFLLKASKDLILKTIGSL